MLAPRQRRRRFPERELLERLRHYEGLLRQNNIKFEPLHAPVVEHASPNEDGRGSDSPDDAHPERLVSRTERLSREKTAVKSRTVNLWHAMSQKTLNPEDDDDNGECDHDSGFLHDNDDIRQAVIKKAWDQVYESEKNDHLLFGSLKTHVDLSTLHPEQVQIFRLWQIHLDNVNPLLKVTHTPTLQARIINAASDVANINPPLEALIFSIYCVSILSLAEDECRTLFRSPKKDLLTSYQVGCQQALQNCGGLRSDDRDCLTALYLYLISVRPKTDPRSLSSIIGVAIRIAQRMGIHCESTYARCTVLEAEMRRRLWWSLMVFDNRICEMYDYKTATLAPTWNCRIPLNVNDFELRLEMKTPPSVHGNPTEALFAVVRSEMGDFVRHSAFHLDFTNPSLNTVAKDTRHGEEGEMIALEKTIEDKYLAFCNAEDPLHFMTIWTTRSYLAKNRLLEHHSRHSTSSTQQTDTQCNAAFFYALGMLECDTKLMTSPLTKGYLWFIHFHFPFPAYIHILQDLRKRPTEDQAEKAWEVMSENYEARIMNVKQDDRPFFIVFARIVLQAWEAREALFIEQDKPLEPPRVVSDIRHKVMQMTASFLPINNLEQLEDAVGINKEEFSLPMLMNHGGHGPLYGTGGQSSVIPGSSGYPDIPGWAAMDVDMNLFDGTTRDWNSMHARGW
ncbi:MAG: hypothetical protein Q9214_004182 [Letrouitia sp. 1 TL-2023]